MSEPTATLDESRTEVTELLPPNDTNNLGRALGSAVLHWMGICGVIAATRFSNRQCVTASMDHIDFIGPTDFGEVAVTEAYVFNVGRINVDIKVDVHAENPKTDERRKTTTSLLTFVALDDDGKLTPVPRLVCKTGKEEELRAEAVVARADQFESVIERMEQGGRSHRRQRRILLPRDDRLATTLDVPVPVPPSPPTVDPNQYDDTQVVADVDFKHAELEGFLEAGAWAGAFEAWAAGTPVTETQWKIVLDLDLLSHFDFFWDDFADHVGYHAPGIPEDWKERELHPELTSWGKVSSISAGLTELGQDVCDVLKNDYIDWESEHEVPDDLPDFG